MCEDIPVEGFEQWQAVRAVRCFELIKICVVEAVAGEQDAHVAEGHAVLLAQARQNSILNTSQGNADSARDGQTACRIYFECKKAHQGREKTAMCHLATVASLAPY